MDLENIVLSELSQTQKDTYYMISLECGIKKKLQMILRTKQKQTQMK